MASKIKAIGLGFYLVYAFSSLFRFFGNSYWPHITAIAFAIGFFILLHYYGGRAKNQVS
jgi:hypothetical protein